MSAHEFANPFATDPEQSDDSRVRRRPATPPVSADVQKRFAVNHPRLRLGTTKAVSPDVADLFEDEPELPPLGAFLRPFIGNVPEDVLRRADMLPTPAQQTKFLQEWAEGPGAESPQGRSLRKSIEFAQLGEAMYRAHGDDIPTTRYKQRELVDREAEIRAIRDEIARRTRPASPPPVPPEVAAKSRARYQNRQIQQALDKLQASDDRVARQKKRAS